jgi:hypothetical protein
MTTNRAMPEFGPHRPKLARIDYLPASSHLTRREKKSANRVGGTEEAKRCGGFLANIKSDIIMRARELVISNACRLEDHHLTS